MSSFDGRLRALSVSHTLLSEAGWEGAELHALVAGQLLLDSADRDRIAIVGPSLLLDPQVALHLALVLHELCTNARKYGVLSVPEGRLEVTWEVEVREGHHSLLLRWLESDGPKVTAPTSHGFGTTLIERSLEAYDGEVSLNYAAAGFVCAIRLPLPVASARPASGSGIVNKPTSSHERSHDSDAASLSGRRVLVVEDEPLVAMELAANLSAAGCVVIGTVATISKARLLIEREKLDACLLDANLGGHPVDELAVLLSRRKVPFAFVTGYGRDALPSSFRGALMLGRPFELTQLRDLMQQLLGNADRVIRLRP